MKAGNVWTQHRGKLLIAGVALLIAVGFAWSRSGQPEYETVVIKRGTMESSVTALGTLQPRSYVDVGAQVSGAITKLHVRPGDTVKKGDLLVEIDPRIAQSTVDAGRAALAALKAQLAEAQAQLVLAEQQFKRQQQMAEQGATRSQDVDEALAAHKVGQARIDYLKAQIVQTQSTLQASETQLGYTRIYAPMNGTVVSVDPKEGQTLNATYQTPNVLRIADLSSMTVWTEVSEADVRRVKAGIPVYFTTLGANGRRWEGSVRQVLPAPPTNPEGAANQGGAQPAKSTSKVVLYMALFDVENGDGELMPQMTAQVSFIAASAKDVLLAPMPALTPIKDKAGWYKGKVLDGNKVEEREIHVGIFDRLQGEILEGVKEGEVLVTGVKQKEPEMPKVTL
jgi:macrolide-specific efflux system membrane fusion protein